MCGIFGAATTRPAAIPVRELTDLLAHRGPDDVGCYSDGTVVLGHRRLSIIDLEGGHQPVFNEDRTKCIVFNGEIYNFPELKGQLTAAGHAFRTKSDTETILHAYEEWGESCVERLRGMFAFAIWDKTNRTLFAARDRLGIKPLFFAEHDGNLYLASEMKAILGVGDFPRRIDEMALASYFMLSYIPAPLTIFTHIRKLRPAHTITWKDGVIRIRKYWDLRFAPDRRRTEKYFVNGLMEVLQESVRSHLISDVPIGAFLSGGVDSSTVVALMSKVSASAVNTFCIGFGGNTGGYLDERGYADMVAKRYSTNHKVYQVSPAPEGLLDKIVKAFDEPFADDSAIPSFYVCKIAKENVSVTLSGLGGDELFAGYERYLGFRLLAYYHLVPRVVRSKLVAGFVNSLPERSDGHYTVNHLKRFVRSGSLPFDQAYMGYVSIMNAGLRNSFFRDCDRYRSHFDACRDLILDHFNTQNVEDGPGSIDRAQYYDMMMYLPEDILALTDRMSMHHSLEVRVPFIDHKMVEFCATIPSEIRMKWLKKKYLLKKAVSGLLPAEVINHRKQGFVGPTAQWIKTDLKAYVQEILSPGRMERHGLIDTGTVKGLLQEHLIGREIHDKLVWALVVFQRWFELYIDSRKASST